MKKSILFASGIALLSFAGCDDGSARINELQTQLDQAKQERDAQSLASQEELTNLTATYQYQVDSLQWIIDSLTAPKGTTASKPKPKPSTTTTPKTEEATGNTNSTRGGTTGEGSNTNTNSSRGGTTNKTDSTGVNTNQKRGGTTNP